MRFQGTKAFNRVWNKLTPERQQKGEEALKALGSFFKQGIKPEGIGLKKLQEPFWEIRTTIKDHILFTLEKDLITFVLIGDHDEVRRFLRHT